MRFTNKIGERKVMKCGEEAEIVEYNKYDDITVKFLKTGELVRDRYNHFKKGTIKSHFTPSVYGVGIIGLEPTWKDGEHIKSYEIWHSMLKRCYDEKSLQKNPTYKKCTVCDEWLYYSKFKQWYEENCYEIEGQRMHLDKDILIKGNKIYSPENCVFVPERVNTLFVKSNAIRGKLPIGVSWKKQNKKYLSTCKIKDTIENKYKQKHLGYYNTSEEAFGAYKQFKENYIKQVANCYKDKIPEKLYRSMYEYEVHIND